MTRVKQSNASVFYVFRKLSFELSFDQELKIWKRHCDETPQGTIITIAQVREVFRIPNLRIKSKEAIPAIYKTDTHLPDHLKELGLAI